MMLNIVGKFTRTRTFRRDRFGAGLFAATVSPWTTPRNIRLASGLTSNFNNVPIINIDISDITILYEYEIFQTSPPEVYCMRLYLIIITLSFKTSILICFSMFSNTEIWSFNLRLCINAQIIVARTSMQPSGLSGLGIHAFLEGLIWIKSCKTTFFRKKK